MVQEYVERQTLKEVGSTALFRGRNVLTAEFQRIAEGLSESEAWRLFQQIVDALVHMSSLNIVSLYRDYSASLCSHTFQLHRDIKLTNIFVGT